MKRSGPARKCIICGKFPRITGELHCGLAHCREGVEVMPAAQLNTIRSHEALVELRAARPPRDLYASTNESDLPKTD